MGHVVVETALENNYQVRAADTRIDRLDSMEHSVLEVAQADVTKKETLILLMDDVMGVISTVDLWRENPPLHLTRLTARKILACLRQQCSRV